MSKVSRSTRLISGTPWKKLSKFSQKAVNLAFAVWYAHQKKKKNKFSMKYKSEVTGYYVIQRDGDFCQDMAFMPKPMDDRSSELGFMSVKYLATRMAGPSFRRVSNVSEISLGSLRKHAFIASYLTQFIGAACRLDRIGWITGIFPGSGQVRSYYSDNQDVLARPRGSISLPSTIKHTDLSVKYHTRLTRIWQEKSALKVSYYVGKTYDIALGIGGYEIMRRDPVAGLRPLVGDVPYYDIRLLFWTLRENEMSYYRRSRKTKERMRI
ncbi:hypothetical protein C8J56DRAFT_899128 [Mycena floridula]|nr:hypothetical protein C8J56DRAFT_899128 [Mycena floridula]